MFYYHQKVGGDEQWRVIPEKALEQVQESMFVTVLAVSEVVPDEATKEDYAKLRYRGPLYFDLDDAESPASTAKHLVQLLNKLVDLGVQSECVEIYASGGKGFHLLVPEGVFMAEANTKGLPGLPAIYKEMAFNLAVESLDTRVYTARKGRMFRQKNVQRPNGLYKVQLNLDELLEIAELDKEDAEARYKELCATPRNALAVQVAEPVMAADLLGMFEAAKAKVNKLQAKRKEIKPVKLNSYTPSFDALLRGEGTSPDAGFHQLALQIAITAHTKGISKKALVDAAEGLINSHQSDGSRYNTPGKRRAELIRMWDYTEDNPCYEYNSKAIVSLLNHNAPDLQGLTVTSEEHTVSMDTGKTEGEEDEFSHAGVVLTNGGVFRVTAEGTTKLTSATFSEVHELISPETNHISVVDATIRVNGRFQGRESFDLEAFSNASKLNLILMRHGQSFGGNDNNARGLFMRLLEKARKGGNKMYTTSREGMDYIMLPGEDDRELREGFLVWADGYNVKSAAGEKLNLRFSGYPDPHGVYKTDLSRARPLAEMMAERPEEMRVFMKNFLTCQHVSHVSKLLGWMTASFYKAIFQKAYSKFPLLHVNGAAGSGKCLGINTPVIMADGTIKMVQDVKVGDQLLGPDGTARNVLSLARGRETLYKVKQKTADDYVVNASHLLSLKNRNKNGGMRMADGTVIPKWDGESQDAVYTVRADVYAKSIAKKTTLKGWKPGCVEFLREQESLEFDPYWLGAWLGDGKSLGPTLCKPKSALTDWWCDYAKENGHRITAGNSGTCEVWSIVSHDGKNNEFLNKLRKLNLVSNKHLPEKYKFSTEQNRLKLLAGLIDTDGTINTGGYRFDTISEKLAEDVKFVAASLGFRATCSKDVYHSKMMNGEHTMYHVYITGSVQRIPTLVKKVPAGNPNKDPLITGIELEELGEGDYYGFTLDGDKLFMLGDFTVTHNTEMVSLFANLHYYQQEVKMLTPSSTLFAIQQTACSSASLPLVIDEYKPGTMDKLKYGKFTEMFREAYNGRNVERGGGSRDNADYRSLHSRAISAPLCFIAETSEQETAVMERVVLITLSKPTLLQAQTYYRRFRSAQSAKHWLGSFGMQLAATVLADFEMEKFKSEFQRIYDDTRREIMLTDQDVGLSEVEYRKKAAAKERTVYNYAVARFGLQKFKDLVESVFGTEFTPLLHEMNQAMTSSVDSLQIATVPEWLKVLNELTLMLQLDPQSAYYPIRNKDFAFTKRNGQDVMELNPYTYFAKYAIFCGTVRKNPLFREHSAFAHALMNNPAHLTNADGQHVTGVPGGTYIFSMQELRNLGFTFSERT